MTRYLGVNVLDAATSRIRRLFDEFDKVYVSFSAGKDSTVLLHLVMQEAILRGRRVGVLLIDLEAQYTLTIEHAHACVRLYRDNIDLYWVALPLVLRNAVSQFQPRWVCWDPAQKERWVRQPPAEAITDVHAFPFFKHGMEFEEFVVEFGHWYADRRLTACCVGIRTQESLNRWRTITNKNKKKFQECQWTTQVRGALFNAYPIYDWKVEDIWTYHARMPDHPYNRIYDRMNAAGLSLSQQRLCQPYGDDQRRGLYLYQVLEPQTWGLVVGRVAGANMGALYAQERGNNVMGNHKIVLPDGHSWRTFAELLLATMPVRLKEHYEVKIAVFLRWYVDRGYPTSIPDEADPKMEAARKVPSWRRICKMLLRNDYWAKGLSFTQTASPSYAAYLRVMRANGQPTKGGKNARR